MDVEEVMYIAKELWRGRSARDQSTKDVGRGMWRSINDLMLVRYEMLWTDHIYESSIWKFLGQVKIGKHDQLFVDVARIC